MLILLVVALIKLAQTRLFPACVVEEEAVKEYFERIDADRSRTRIVPGNDSLGRCLAELRARFAGRGMMQSVRRDAQSQRAAVMTTRAMAPSAYADYGLESTVSDRFRTGICDGERYMTSGDFVRYYREHRRKARPDADLRSMAVTRDPRRPVPVPKDKPALLDPASEKSRKLAHRLVSKLPASVREAHPMLERRTAELHTWLTADEIKEAPKSERRRFPVSVASAILVMTISLSLVVGGTVMYSDANSKYREASERLEALSDEADNLERCLAVKLDLAEAEDYARNTLGMVDKTYVGGEYLDAPKTETVEVYEEEKPTPGLSTLLSAFGFGG